MRWIQAAVNNYSESFDRSILEGCGLARGAAVEWVSPLANDEYAEYRDQDFLDQLGLQLRHRALADFWPKRGPQWDALGRTSDGKYLLVEAKANIPEIVSSATMASIPSRQLIEKSLEETKAFMKVSPSIPWSGKLYQYANRLAHLYLLRELNRIDAHLLFVYFIGDEDVVGPGTVGEWQAALTVAKAVLGIPQRHPLSRFVHDIYVHVDELTDSARSGGSAQPVPG